MKSKVFTGTLKKRGTGLVYVTEAQEVSFRLFKDSLKEDSLVEVFMEIQKDDGTLAQLAKIHSMIRELCNHTGDTFEDMKLIIKKRAGLCIQKELDGSTFLYCKSFGDCSKEQLSLAIQAIFEVSVLLEFPLQ